MYWLEVIYRKTVDKVLNNTIGIQGFKGIVRNAIANISALELPYSNEK